MKSGAENTRALCGAALLLSVLTAPAALAVPSFARQTGMACEACHTVYPELTHFGRVFKANGYVLANLKQVRDVTAKKEQLLELAQTPPLSIMERLWRSLDVNDVSVSMEAVCETPLYEAVRRSEPGLVIRGIGTEDPRQPRGGVREPL